MMKEQSRKSLMSKGYLWHALRIPQSMEKETQQFS